MASWAAFRTCALITLAAPLTVAAILLILIVGWLAYLKLQSLDDPLAKLPGSSVGHFRQGIEGDVETWARKHANGPTNGKTPRNYRVPGPWPIEGRHRLVTMDPQVISYILNSPDYEKPGESTAFLNKLLGRGIFAAEGADHKVLRKAYSPAFTKSVHRVLEPVMLHKAEQVCELLSSRVKDGNAKIDSQSWFHRAALDVVAALGFGEDLNAIADEKDPIFMAYRQMLDMIERGQCGLGFVLSLYFSWWHRIFPDRLSRTWDAAHQTIMKIGRSLLQHDASKSAEKDEEITAPSLLASIIRESSKGRRVPDSELLGHISTFMFNGADSVGSAAAWALHHLSLDQTLQGRLREELSHISNDASRSSALESAPLLSCVVRETMRFCPPLPGTIRVACKDDIIRASEDITLCDGSVVREYRIKKGQIIMIPIEPMNILSDYWGEDAKVFNPDRWLNLPETAKSFPGLHGTMTFTFGPHGCPGSNLAFAMMRSFISSVVQHFEVHPAAEIGRSCCFMLRPFVRGSWASEGVQLPLIFKPVST